MPKLYIKSYGCQMNEYDSAKIVELMVSSHNFTSIDNPEKADLIVLNTCSIRDKAAEKVFSDLGRFRDIKNKKPNLIIAVGGCVSSQEKENIFRRAQYVNIVFGPQTLHHLPKMFYRATNKEKKIIDTSFPAIEKFDYLPKPSQTGPIAYVSIMEGCNKFCSYCVVPYTRGREISRGINEILDEITNLAEKGAKEIHLLGQNVNAYRDPKKGYTLPYLMKRVAKIESIQRIRFTTSHPKEFGDDLIKIFAEEPKLVNHLHLPIQSGSNRILKLMRRAYTIDDYKKIIDKIRKVRPNIKVSTDIIVGFPTETEEDFAETMNIVKEINFDTSYTFIYSPRPNTPAAKMEDNITLEEKKKRLLMLQTRLADQARHHNKEMVGTLQTVLATNHSKKNNEHFSGRTESNRIVNFDAPPGSIGKIAKIRITEVLPNSLRGEFYSF